MELGDLRGLGTVFCMIGFAMVVYWAYGPSRKAQFEEAGRIPFKDSQGEGEQQS